MLTNKRYVPLLLALVLLISTSFFMHQSSEKSAIERARKNSIQVSREMLIKQKQQRRLERLRLSRIVGENGIHPSSTVNRGDNNQLIFSPAIQQVDDDRIADKLFPYLLFSVKSSPLRGKLSLNKHSLSAVEAGYDHELLADFLDSGASELIFPLSAHRQVTVKVDNIISRGAETHTLLGSVKEIENSDVLIVFHDGFVSGHVALRGNEQYYEYGSAGNGDIVIRLLDPASYTEKCTPPSQQQVTALSPRSAEPSNLSGPNIGIVEPKVVAEQISDTDNAKQGEAATISNSIGVSDSPSILMDSVIGYGAGARAGAGGTAAIEADIIVAMDRINVSFGNSNILGVQAVLLSTLEDPSYLFPGEISGDMGSGDELGHLNNTGDGFLDAITDAKIALGADHAGFIIRDTDGSAGVAYRPGSSMIVARNYMNLSRLTFVHEYGHNLGCRHAWGDTANDSLVNVSNYGWRFRTSSNQRVRTVMSYNWSWSRIPYFSNPNVLYQGSRTGVNLGEDVSGDPRVDDDFLSGGGIDTLGAGYDGSNPNLGANNSAAILAGAQRMANRAARAEPEIVIQDSSRNGSLTDNECELLFKPVNYGVPVLLTLEITNDGSFPLGSISTLLDGTHSSDFSTSTLPESLAPGESALLTITYTPKSLDLRNATLHILSDDYDKSSFDISLSAAPRNNQQSDSFEGGFGNWSNTNTFDFRRRSGSTPTGRTGPSVASEGVQYIYTEASSNFNKIADIETVINLTGRSNASLSFLYHMHGEDVGSLSLDINNGSWQENVWRRNGPQQASSNSPWNLARVDLSSYTGESSLTLRLRATTGDGYQSDIALDDIRVDSVDLATDTYETWAAFHSLSGEDALSSTSVQKDGISNLLKFAFNIAPRNNEFPRVIPNEGTYGLPYTRIIAPLGGPLQVEYIRRKNSLAVSYEVEFSSSLTAPNTTNGWAATGTVISITPVGDKWERVIVQDSETYSPTVNRFARVRVRETP